MKIFGFIMIFGISLLGLAQEHPSSASTRAMLQSWDNIRGEWLFQSMEALAKHRTIPDRTFPEDLTPFEVLSLALSSFRNSFQDHLNKVPKPDLLHQLLSNLVDASFCELQNGRSYGDPHIITYDNTSYSFQTVGEFVLSRVGSNFEIQARQKPQRDDFSLNTAVAIRLFNDTISYYADDTPDGSDHSLWLNGEALILQGRTHYLPCGGTIRLIGKDYVLAGPMGEKVVFDVRGSGSRRFVNITVGIPSCTHNNSIGLLGNGNGNRYDEFQSNDRFANNGLNNFTGMNSDPFLSLSQQAEQLYQIQLTKEYAEQFRVTKPITLFLYRPGLNTDFYTDRSFPRIIRTFNEIPNNQRELARNRCRQLGVTEAEMNGCIFDVHYLDLPPNPSPNVVSNTHGVILDKLNHPVVNSNTVAPTKFPQNNAQPIDKKPIEALPNNKEPQPEKEPHSTPWPESKPHSVPLPEKSPSPKPVTPSAPAPKPNSAPAPVKPSVKSPSKGKN